MKRHRILSVLLWPIVVTTAAAGQGMVPDFSGHWVLESGQPTGAAAARTLAISQSLVGTSPGAPPRAFTEVTVVRGDARGSRTETFRVGVAGATIPGWRRGEARGPVSHYRATWENSTLVIESGSYTGSARESGEWTERRETWVLDPAGRLRVTITTRGSDRSPTTVEWIYRREQVAPAAHRHPRAVLG